MLTIIAKLSSSLVPVSSLAELSLSLIPASYPHPPQDSSVMPLLDQLES